MKTLQTVILEFVRFLVHAGSWLKVWHLIDIINDRYLCFQLGLKVYNVKDMINDRYLCFELGLKVWHVIDIIDNFAWSRFQGFDTLGLKV